MSVARTGSGRAPGGDTGAAPLVLHHGAIGDTILLTAMLRSLARRWGRPCDVLAGGAPAAVLFQGLDFVDRVQVLGTRKTPYLLSRHQRALVDWLRQRGPGPAWVVERWRHRVAPWSDLTRLEWLLRRSGTPRSGWVSRLDCPRGPLEYAVTHQRRMARLDPPDWQGRSALAAPEPAAGPRLVVLDEEREECVRWLRARGWSGEPLVLVQTGARRPHIKGRWPDRNWLELARAILSRLPEGWLLFIGSPQQRAAVEALTTRIADPRVREAASRMTLRRLFALLELAHSCISLDTAPAQAAVALGCPVVVLSGTGDPRRSMPVDSPDRVQVATAWPREDWPDDPQVWFDTHLIAEIPAQTVLEAWQRLGPDHGPSPVG